MRWPRGQGQGVNVSGIPAAQTGTERNGTEFRGIPVPFRQIPFSHRNGRHTHRAPTVDPACALWLGGRARTTGAERRYIAPPKGTRSHARFSDLTIDSPHVGWASRSEHRAAEHKSSKAQNRSETRALAPSSNRNPEQLQYHLYCICTSKCSCSQPQKTVQCSVQDRQAPQRRKKQKWNA